jgi:hypothetical protein
MLANIYEFKKKLVEPGKKIPERSLYFEVNILAQFILM